MSKRWRLARRYLLRNKAAALLAREPMLAEFQRKKKYLYKDWVICLMQKGLFE